MHHIILNLYCSVKRSVSEPEYLKGLSEGYLLITKDGDLTGPVSAQALTSSARRSAFGFSDYYSDRSSRCPTADQLGFNDSQYEAFKMALTKEFVVIQGK